MIFQNIIIWSINLALNILQAKSPKYCHKMTKADLSTERFLVAVHAHPVAVRQHSEKQRKINSKSIHNVKVHQMRAMTGVPYDPGVEGFDT